MAKTTLVPGYIRAANALMAALLRTGLKIKGFGRPAYLLTVRGRKTGQPRTTPLVVIEQDGQRYLVSPFGLADWVRNLRAAGEATLTRGRRAETVRAIELPNREAGIVLQRSFKSGIPAFLAERFDVTAESSLEDFERTTIGHPVFLLQRAA
jgi:deazaflavin-dependent oxidoreductase (nitroreductase family)